MAQEAIDLKTNTRYQAALRALDDELPDLAAQRLKEFLDTIPPKDPARIEVTLRMGEAWVRSGEARNGQGSEDARTAIKVLADPSVAKLDRAIFWKANAQVVLGSLKDASDTLALLSAAKDVQLRNLATIGRARLLGSLGNLAEASALLATIKAPDNPALAQETLLLRTSLLLEASLTDEAEKLLQTVKPKRPGLLKRQIFLQARLAMAKEDFPSALTHFQTLIDDSSHLTTALYRSTILGAATASHKLTKTAEAIELLSNYVDAHPDSDFLDPFFERLTKWSAASDTLRTDLLNRIALWAGTDAPEVVGLLRSTNEPTTIALIQSVILTRTKLEAHALFHQALLLAEKNDAKSVYRARTLLNQLRLYFPSNPLATQSWLETGRLYLAEKNPERATAALLALSAIAKSPALQSAAAELIARVEYSQGDYADAAGAFARARSNLQRDDQFFTAINHGLSLLQADDHSAFGGLLTTLSDAEAMTTLTLEQALVAAAKGKPNAGSLLDNFLRLHPESPRIVEARLALAEIAVRTEPYNLDMAAAQLDSISIDPDKLSQPFALRHLLARLRHAELTGEWDTAIAEANTYLSSHKGLTDGRILLKLGEAYYLNRDYNKARIQFGSAVDHLEDPALKNISRFYGAKAALRVGTDEARNDAVTMLEEVVASNSLLATDARLQLASAFRDATKPEEAIKILAPLLENPEAGQAHIDALIITAEASRMSDDRNGLEHCLELYDRILDRQDLDYPLNNRIHFLKGLTLEHLGQPAKALDSYYRVINGENLNFGEQINEWQWYYKCGFRALRLLEVGKRWRSAFGVAQRLSKSGGPRAEEAAKRAQVLQLNHMIWSKEK